MVFHKHMVVLRLIRILNPEKKSRLWLTEHFFFSFFVKVAFLLDLEEFPCSEVSIKFLKVIMTVFTYGFILLHLKMAVQGHLRGSVS